jgi:hypothetical protein
MDEEDDMIGGGEEEEEGYEEEDNGEDEDNNDEESDINIPQNDIIVDPPYCDRNDTSNDDENGSFQDSPHGKTNYDAGNRPAAAVNASAPSPAVQHAHVPSNTASRASSSMSAATSSSTTSQRKTTNGGKASEGKKKKKKTSSNVSIALSVSATKTSGSFTTPISCIGICQPRAKKRVFAPF